MCKKFTPNELNKMDHQSKNDIIYRMQERLDKLEHDYENLMEQIRLANQQKFGRSTEKLSEIPVSYPSSMNLRCSAMKLQKNRILMMSLMKALRSPASQRKKASAKRT